MHGELGIDLELVRNAVHQHEEKELLKHWHDHGSSIVQQFRTLDSRHDVDIGYPDWVEKDLNGAFVCAVDGIEGSEPVDLVISLMDRPSQRLKICHEGLVRDWRISHFIPDESECLVGVVVFCCLTSLKSSGKSLGGVCVYQNGSQV